MPPDARPEPDEVLARFKQGQTPGTPGADGEGRARGRLKIFLGMAPGVGKTYAMLEEAQRLAGRGVDVVVGVVETHGRAETERMLLGLDILPRRAVAYGAATLSEFDTEAATGRRPDVLLVDELAHSNAPGSPRQKRWQDVLACLDAGVDVYTTLNVQHIESLNDVVAQITGVKVGETVPDRVFDEADEVELVDLPPEALRERLRAGKVYTGDGAARAVDPADGFFRKGNLAALRELALRRTAAWVDSDMRRYQRDRGIRALWPAAERIVVAVSPSPMSGRVIRAAKRMAAGLHAELIAVHARGVSAADLPAADRDRLAEHLRLAESLGATTATVRGPRPAAELIAFARSRNCGRIVVGKTDRPRWREALSGSFIDELIRGSGDIDIYVVRGDDAADPAPREPSPPTRAGARARRLWRFPAAVAVVGAGAMVAWPMYRPPDLSEEALVLLGSVVLAALWFGRGAAVAASVAAVLAFNFLFTEPRYTFLFNDPGYVITFSVMLTAGLVVGTLAARAREQAERAAEREARTSALFVLSRELGSARGAEDVAAAGCRHAHDLLGLDTVIAAPLPGLQPGSAALGVLGQAGTPDWFDERERAVARWCCDHAKPAGAGTRSLPAAVGRYIPLVGTSGVLGVLGVRLSGRPATDSEWLDLLASLAAQVASALERVTLAESQQAARLEAERERLRSALLSSVSHDLRTPLASITGAATALQQSDGPAPLDGATRAALLSTIVDESARLSDIIANLVFATRLESGAVSPRRDWTTLEEVVGVGLSRHRAALAARPVRVHLPADLPLLRVDSAMLPQVVHNLVENALRYTPAGTPIAISAWASEAGVFLKVADEGPGLADDEASKVFQRFYRGRSSRVGTGGGEGGHSGSSTGMGLGLTICEGIIRAHGGRIWAEPNTPRGVAFLFSLPVEHPQPSMPPELLSVEERTISP